MTPADIAKAGAMPDFKLECVPYVGYSNIDSQVYTGCGLKDLNHMIDAATFFMQQYPRGVLLFYRPWHGDETGASDTASDVFRIQPVDIDDIVAVRDAFVAYWGAVDRPTDWLNEPS